jgi:hypothetical protein
LSLGVGQFIHKSQRIDIVRIESNSEGISYEQASQKRNLNKIKGMNLNGSSLLKIEY